MNDFFDGKVFMQLITSPSEKCLGGNVIGKEFSRDFLIYFNNGQIWIS